MKTIKLFLLPLLLVLLLFDCSQEDGDNGGALNPDIAFAAEVDGRKFETTLEFVAATFSTENTSFYQFGITAFDYENISTGLGQSITFSFTGANFDDLKPGDEFGDNDLAFGLGTMAVYIDHTILMTTKRAPVVPLMILPISGYELPISTGAANWFRANFLSLFTMKTMTSITR
ncbi:MAG: hypothetical protein AAF944_03185 [Bacteroidota bacterium]